MVGKKKSRGYDIGTGKTDRMELWTILGRPGGSGLEQDDDLICQNNRVLPGHSAWGKQKSHGELPKVCETHIRGGRGISQTENIQLSIKRASKREERRTTNSRVGAKKKGRQQHGGLEKTVPKMALDSKRKRTKGGRASNASNKGATTKSFLTEKGGDAEGMHRGREGRLQV